MVYWHTWPQQSVLFLLFLLLRGKMTARSPLASHIWVWFSMQLAIWKLLTEWMMLKCGRCDPALFFSTAFHGQNKWQIKQIGVYPLTRGMSWRSWCCHENGDTLGWHTESLLPCWYKLSLGYSCAAGLNIRPHLEDKTAEACKNEKRGKRLARLPPCFLVTAVWAGGTVLWLFIWFFSLVSHKRLMS